MSGFISFKELIERALEFERELEHYYAEIRDTTQNEGVRLITYYLSRHRRRLQQAIDNLQKGTLEHLFKVKFKYDIEFAPEKDFHPLNKAIPDITGDELLEAAANYDVQLIELYKKILSNPMNVEASSFVESLIRMEEKDVVMLKKMLATHYF